MDIEISDHCRDRYERRFPSRDREDLETRIQRMKPARKKMVSAARRYMARKHRESLRRGNTKLYCDGTLMVVVSTRRGRLVALTCWSTTIYKVREADRKAK